MSQAGILNSSGGGGGGDITLTPDSGSALVGTSFPVLGATSGSSQTMETYTSGADFLIADQTFTTRYVVDPSSTTGLKGTYTTIQAAVNQASADGWSYLTTGICTIFIRRGAYTENISIPNNLAVHLLGYTPSGANTQLGDAVIVGSITLGTSTYVAIENVGMNSGGVADGITVPAGVFGFTMKDSVILGGTNSSINFTGSSQASFLYNVTLGGNLRVASTTVNLNNSALSGTTFITGTGVVNMFGSQPGSVTLADNAAVLMSESRASGTVTGTTSNTCSFYNSRYLAPNANNTFLNYTGIANISNVEVTNGSNLYASTVTVLQQPSSQGNVIKRTATAADYVVLYSDYYIGVTSTAAARAITLPDPSTISVDQCFIIKDESMAAGTNNITITPAAGNIDGAANKVINTNGGSVTAISDGTNYFII